MQQKTMEWMRKQMYLLAFLFFIYLFSHLLCICPFKSELNTSINSLLGAVANVWFACYGSKYKIPLNTQAYKDDINATTQKVVFLYLRLFLLRFPFDPK